MKWKDEDRFIIGDYARKNGNSAALGKFRSRFPGLKESTIRSFKARVVKEVKDVSKEKRAVVQSSPKYSLRTGRPLMLGEIDQMVQTYIKAVSSRGGLVTRTLANAAAKTLMARYPNLVGNIDVDSSSWAKSLFKRMEIIAPYLKEERKKLGLEISHKGLLIMNVFTGQMTTDVLDVITKNNIFVVNVPANMTKFYQPLDLTVNGYAKRFFKSKFSAWYADQISKQLNEGVKIEEADAKFRLTTMKPLHAQWVVDFYNEMTTSKGSTIIESG